MYYPPKLGCIEQLRPELHAKVCAYEMGTTRADGTNGTPNGTNGSAKQLCRPAIAVHLVDPVLNRTHLAAVSRALCRSEPADITIPLVDATVGQLQQSHGLPDPELAFYFDEHCCTYGLSPWQIRLTEFVRLERDVADVQLGSYLRALCKYAKCEQRFGK